MSPLGWVVLIILVSLVVVVNIALVVALWRRGKTGIGGILNKTGGSLRNPWQREDDELDELARRADELRRRQDDSSGINH